mmetsp:Transcript_1120/g.1459  ORF Transcript_1120/g.1459 Transcript_1120/m.1459 type:complete len:189 (+) Transcript_1120:335-901(+)
MATSTAGVQIYLLTSFTFTLFQSIALRNDTFRALVKLPSMNVTHDAPLASEFQKLRELQDAAIQARGPDKPVLGTGVLAPGWVASFEGRARESSIAVEGETITGAGRTLDGSGGGGASNSVFSLLVNESDSGRGTIPNIPVEVMDAANKGASLPRPIVMAPKDDKKGQNDKPLNLSKRNNTGKRSKKK